MLRRLRTGLAVAIALGAVFGVHRIVDPDPFQRLALGREILANPHALGASHLLSTNPGFPFVDDKWLTSVLVALSFSAGGAAALMLYQIALPALLGGAWYAMLRVWGAAPSAALAGTALALIADAYRLEPRPDTISQILLAALVALLGSRASLRSLLWAVVGTMALWVNLHGYFVEGLLVLLAAGIAAAAGDDRLLPAAAHDRRGRAARLGALLAFGSAAGLLHPQGVAAFLWPWRQIGILDAHPVLRRAIQEFFPTAELFEGTTAARAAALAAVILFGIALRPTIGRRRPALAPLASALVAAAWLALPGPGFAGWPYRLTFALLAASLVELPFEILARRWFPALLLAGFGILAVPLVRNLSTLPPLALLVLAPGWSRAIALHVEERRVGWRRTEIASASAAAAIVLVAAALRLSDRLAPGGYRAPGWTGWGIEEARFPAAAADFLARESAPGPILNGFDDGGFLLTRLGAGRTVFIADNTSMYPPDFLETYRREIMGEGGHVADPFARFGARTVILSHSAMETPKLVRHLATDPSWTLVYLDRVAAVFVHRGGDTESWLSSRALDLAREAAREGRPAPDAPLVPRWLGGRRHLFPALNFGVFLRLAGRPDLALAEADRMWREGPAVELATFTAAAAEEAGRLPEAIPRLEAALAREPRSEVLRSWLARALFFRGDAEAASGDLDAARRDLERCRSLGPAEAGPWLALARIAAQRGENGAAAELLAGALARSVGDSMRRRAEADPLLAPLLHASESNSHK